MRSLITIRGSLEGKLKENSDGSADILTKIDSPNGYSKDSFALLKLNKKIYKDKKDWINSTKGNVRIDGNASISVNSKGIPFIRIDVLNIDILSLSNEKNIDKIKLKAEKQAKLIEEENKKFNKKWYTLIDENEFQTINVEDIFLVEDIHKKGIKHVYGVNANGFVSPIAIRKIENGKYAMVAGLRGYLTAKIFNISEVKVFITELDHSQFINKYQCIEEFGKKI